MHNKTLLANAVAATLALASAGASATIIVDVPNLAGGVLFTDFADGSPETFSATFRNLVGTFSVNPLSAGGYKVYVEGSASLDPDGPGPGAPLFNIQNAPLTHVYMGYLASTGLSAATYTFGPAPVPNATYIFNFTISYDGYASSSVMSFLQSFGMPFVNPDGAGKLAVSGSLTSRPGAGGLHGTLYFTESDLTWRGFGKLLKEADETVGLNNGQIGGAFALQNFKVTAEVAEPATLGLLGLGLMGLAAARRRKAA